MHGPINVNIILQVVQLLHQYRQTDEKHTCQI